MSDHAWPLCPAGHHKLEDVILFISGGSDMATHRPDFFNNLASSLPYFSFLSSSVEAFVNMQRMNWFSNSCWDTEANWILLKCTAHLTFSERSFKRHLGLGSHPVPFWLASFKIGSTSHIAFLLGVIKWSIVESLSDVISFSLCSHTCNAFYMFFSGLWR